MATWLCPYDVWKSPLESAWGVLNTFLSIFCNDSLIISKLVGSGTFQHVFTPSTDNSMGGFHWCWTWSCDLSGDGKWGGKNVSDFPLYPQKHLTFAIRSVYTPLMTGQHLTGFTHFSHGAGGPPNPQPSNRATSRLRDGTLVFLRGCHCGMWAHLLHSNNRVGFYL